MRHLVVADLRHSLRIWAGSLAVLATAQVCIMWVTGLFFVGITNLGWAGVPLEKIAEQVPEGVRPEILRVIPTGIISLLTISFIVVAIVGSITIRNVVNAIVYQRRRVMALWQLAGMTDKQSLRILRGQVALLSLAALVIAAVAAVTTVPVILDLLTRVNLLIAPPMSTSGVYLGYAIGAFVSVLICVSAVRGASKELEAISPLEAIRSEGVRELRMTKRRWIGFGVWGALAVSSAFSAIGATKLNDAAQSALIAGLLGIVVCNVAGPVVVVGIMRGWTSLVPAHVSASWFLARQTLLAATSRSVATIGSVSIAVFLFTTQFSQPPTKAAETPADTIQVDGFVLLVGFPLLIAVVGSVVLVFIAGQQREREIHLAELAGATPAQQFRQALFEGIIVVVTGSGLGLVFVCVTIALLQPAQITVTGSAAFTVSLGHFAGITLALLLLNIVATVVPTMIAQSTRDRIASVE